MTPRSTSHRYPHRVRQRDQPDPDVPLRLGPEAVGVALDDPEEFGRHVRGVLPVAFDPFLELVDFGPNLDVEFDVGTDALG